MDIHNTVTEADLRQAWRECALVNCPYEQAMQIKPLAIAITRLAEANNRRRERLLEQQSTDRKRAQAHDLFDTESE
jgi:hypothetical protein